MTKVINYFKWLCQCQKAAFKNAEVIAAFLLMLFLFMLSACSADKMPSGIVASVNGKNISLESLQMFLDSREAYKKYGTSLDEMCRSYANALGQLIISALVYSELEQKKLLPDENDINLLIEQISNDYGENGLQQFLDDSLLSWQQWIELTKNHLVLETFKNKVLLPAIKIEFDEVKDYYKQHKANFALPETYKVCFLTASSKDALKELCGKIAEKDFAKLNLVQCMDIKKEELLEPWKKENIRQGACGKSIEKNGEWQTIALLEKNSAKMPELSAVYALIENILLESKKTEAFNQWLQTKIMASKILINSEIAKCLDNGTALSNEMQKTDN